MQRCCIYSIMVNNFTFLRLIFILYECCKHYAILLYDGKSCCFEIQAVDINAPLSNAACCIAILSEI